MAIDPTLELQKAIYGALTAAGVVAYDKPPRDPPPPATPIAMPYWAIGEMQVLGDSAQGYDGSEVNCTLHGWSRATGMTEIRTQAGLVRATLAPIAPIEGGPPPFALPTHQLVNWTYESTRYIDDPDGVTKHAVVTIQYLTRPY